MPQGKIFTLKNARKRKNGIFCILRRLYYEACHENGGNGLRSLFSDARRSEVLTQLQIRCQDCGNFGFGARNEAPCGWRATPSEFPRKLTFVINLRKARQR